MPSPFDDARDALRPAADVSAVVDVYDRTVTGTLKTLLVGLRGKGWGEDDDA